MRSKVAQYVSFLTLYILKNMPKSLVLVCMAVTIEKIEHNGQGVMLSLRTDQ